MKISFIVPAFNEERLIGETLSAIKNAAAGFIRRGWDTELIVCDNNSTDRTGEIARAAGATVVFEPVNQIARARNSGAAAATGEWLLFVDADSQPSRELLEDVARAIETGDCVAGGATLKLHGSGRTARWITSGWNWVSRRFKFLAGSFIFCETATFRSIGGFSDKLFAAEELDLCKRLKKAARARRKRIVILDRHPMLTSDRKIHLYTGSEHLRFILKAVLLPSRTLASREACRLWYDGRR
jgi:glycosyltransferase involved in cell wall biosynthesis